MAVAVAELFLSPLLEVLYAKLASTVLQSFARQEGIRSQLKKWSKSLEWIQAVILDAEDKQITDKFIKLWLESLREVAYDLDDVVDEISTVALRQKLLEPDRPRESKCFKFLSTCQNFSNRSIKSNPRIASKIQTVTCKLDEVVKRKNDLNLSVPAGKGGTSSRSEKRPPTTSLVEPHVYGRDEDRKEILKMLFQSGETCQGNVCVIPIVGMGGVGKTTLAQFVYNDETVDNFFSLKAWVCVSEEFDVTMVTKTIFESVTKTSGKSKDLNTLQETLKERLSKEKFLLILDDVWNENYHSWDLLCRPFQVGLPGSKVIVTTRLVNVADLVRSRSILPYFVNQLTDEDCLSLFTQHALGKRNFDEHPSLRQSGEKLAKKCGGLPLAAKALGGILRSKDSPSEWEDVLNSKIWDLPQETEILPVLRLSYYHLPSHLKQLFAYCSVFPKDYEFDRHELVLLWMGEGFLREPNGRKTMEEFGFECFNELASRSFFQRLRSRNSCFVMHDLINDLAQFVAGGTCQRLDDKIDIYESDKLSDNTRHASFLRHEYEVYKKFQALQKVQGLRTFIPMPVQNAHVWPPFYLSNIILRSFLPELECLRVLSLSGYSISELPSSICSLLHLRYLNLSGTAITALPESLGYLYNLQTLSLRNCRSITKLPETLGDLVNLRHLDNAGTDQLKGMPVGIGKLTSLQTLPKIVIGRSCGLRLTEMKNLTLLRGMVSVVELQNVTDILEAKEANLKQKTCIEDLQMSWSDGDVDSRNEIQEFNVLESLQPHEHLQKLKIDFFGGMKFPTWIGDPLFLSLNSISLSNCAKCTSLPPLGQLPALKHLRIGGMPGVKCIGDEFLKSNYPLEHPFPCLETLRFDSMPEWEEWSCGTGDRHSEFQFPRLHQLSIYKCQKLAKVSSFSLPYLHELDLHECNKVILHSFKHLNSLTYLKLESITGFTCLSRDLFQYTEKLEALEICNCDELLSLWENDVSAQSLTSLKRLVIEGCSNIVCLGDKDQQLPLNLEVLEIFGCATLSSLPMELSKLKTLREIIIKSCPKLVSFPETGVPPMLRRLELQGCNALNSLPNGLSNLERLELKDCSSLRAWSEGSFPTAFKKVVIINVEHLEPVPDRIFEQNCSMSLAELNVSNWENLGPLLRYMYCFSYLAELHISHCETLESFPDQGLPTPNLRILSIEYCSQLKSTPSNIHRISSLVSLEIRGCSNLETFPESNLPSSLSSLRIWDSRKLRPLAEWKLDRLTSLKELSLCGGFSKHDSFADDENLFPSSITRLSIARFKNLKSMSKCLDRLAFLQQLSLMTCPKLKNLPSQAILNGLWRLEISNCKKLKDRCMKDRGDYWPMIADIPCVEIDVNEKES